MAAATPAAPARCVARQPGPAGAVDVCSWLKISSPLSSARTRRSPGVRRAAVGHCCHQSPTRHEGPPTAPAALPARDRRRSLATGPSRIASDVQRRCGRPGHGCRRRRRRARRRRSRRLAQSTAFRESAYSRNDRERRKSTGRVRARPRRQQVAYSTPCRHSGRHTVDTEPDQAIYLSWELFVLISLQLKFRCETR